MPDSSGPGKGRRPRRIVPSRGFAEWLFVGVAVGALPWLWEHVPKSIDDLRKLAINLLIVAAMVLILLTVWRAFNEQQAILEPLTVPKSLEEQHGYTGPIVARRLLDQVEHINATARTRVARVKIGQESQFASLSGLQVPSSGLTIQTFVSLLRTLFGRQDERIGGEITIRQSAETPSRTVYQMLLRFNIARDTEDRLGRPTDSRYFVKVLESPKLGDLIDLSAQAIVENTTPVVLASYLYSVRKWKDLDKLLGQLVVSSKPNILRQALILRGMRLLDKCDLKGSLDPLEKAAAMGEYSGFAQSKYGDALVKVGRPGDAIKQFEQAHEGKAGPLVYSSWAKALVRQNKPDDALKKLEEAERVVGKDPRIYRTWGDILSDDKVRRYKQAAEKYQIAVALDPESWVTYDNWGNALLKDGDSVGATEKFRLAIDIDPSAPEPHYGLLEALLGQKDIDGAIKALRDTVNVIDSEYAAGLSAMADDLARNPDLARKALETVAAKAPRPCPSSQAGQEVRQ